MTNLDSILKSRDITLLTKVCLVIAMVFPVVMYECENWVLKNQCFWTMVLDKTHESPLNCKEIKSVNLKGNQSWILIGRTVAEAEDPILWPPDAKNWLNGKDPDVGKDWRQEKRTTEDEMVGWHHQLDGRESEQALGVGDGQGSLASCSPWDCKELDTTEQLNWTEESRSKASHHKKKKFNYDDGCKLDLPGWSFHNTYNIESLCGIPETNMMLYASYISIKRVLTKNIGVRSWIPNNSPLGKRTVELAQLKCYKMGWIWSFLQSGTGI